MSAYAPANPTAAYQQSAILTAPPEKLVVMLYDGCRRFLFQAAAAMREGDITVTNSRLQRAEAIIDELNATLDLSVGEIAHNLQGIYVFCRRLLNEARVERDPEKIDTVWTFLGELRDAWAQIAGA